MHDEMKQPQDDASIHAAVDARIKAEAEELMIDEKKDDAVTPQFVRDCLESNRLGDGALFAALNKGRFLFNLSSKDEWYRWTGHHWNLDAYNARFSEGVEAVVKKYLEEADRLTVKIKTALAEDNKDLALKLKKRHNAILTRIYSLRDVGADKCLVWATRTANLLGIRGEEFDTNPWLFACRNGVVELTTGRFRPGHPEDNVTKAAPHEWAGIDAPAPMFMEFLDTIFEGDAELIGFVQRYFGYGIYGGVTTHAFAILFGEGGRNGKGTLVETINYVLGPLSGPIQAEMLLDQKVARSSSGPSPDTMRLKGLRLAFASETDDGRKFSATKIKWLSGGDTLIGRHPNDKYEISFTPTHLLCLLTNNLPYAPAEDHAFWDRMHVIPFNIRFIVDPKTSNERRRVDGLAEKLKAEASGILAWLVRGCLEWQRRGLDPPETVRNATALYRFREDDLARFIEAKCYPPDDTDPNDRVSFKDLYNAFKSWFEDYIGDIKFAPKKKKFGQMIEKRATKKEKGGNVWFYGLSLKPEDAYE